MDRDTVKFNFFSLENIKFQKLKIYHPDCRNISMKYKPNIHSGYIGEMNFNTTWMSTPYGVNSYNNKVKKKYYIDLSFSGREKSIYIKQLFNIIKKIDKYIPYLVENNQIDLLEHDELFDYTYIPTIKIIEDNPAIKLKIFPKTVKIFNVDTNKIDNISLDRIGEQYEVRAKIHCHSLWIMNKKYGLTWIAKELHIRKKSKRSYIHETPSIKREDVRRLFYDERIYSKSI